MSRKIEALHQQTVINYLRISYPEVLYNISPANTISPFYGKLNKKMGLTKGFPDLFLYLPTKKYHGLAIELKRPEKRDCFGKVYQTKGSLSSEQKACLEKLNILGYRAVTCYGSEEAIKAIEEYMK